MTPVSTVAQPPSDPAPPQPAMESLANPAPNRGSTHVWRVVGVHDGDTLTCLDETNTQQKVRLAEIDAPELGQDYGKVSREALAEMVFGKTVTVSEEGKDRYGRWIAHVQVNGIDVNRQQVATGNAWHYSDYSRDPTLATLQTDAQARRLGLWSQPEPVPPWDFRQTVKKAAAG
jgi:endonuclease YncB( thermonuclease family)